MPKQFLPLRVAEDIEVQQSWNGISTPNELAKYFSRVLAVDPSSIVGLQETVYSSVRPQGEDANKLWIKTTEPVGIGIPVGGSYRMIFEEPVNTPYLFIGDIENIPSYARRLTDTERSDYALGNPAETKASWVIIEVDTEISVNE